jgi:chorismate synthase
MIPGVIGVPRLRFLTAGESHGPALAAILEGMPAGLSVSRADIERELARRRLGYGRSPRMAFEEDRVEVLGGIRHGRTLGSPVSIVIHNTEWPKWVDAMDPEPRDDLDVIRASGRGAPLTRPRPGHADLVGALKYGYDDVRDALERASARETAARVAIGAVAKRLLAEAGVTVLSQVVNIGGVRSPDDVPLPDANDLAAIDASPVRCFDAHSAARMQERIDEAKADNDTLGGVIELVAHGLPPGLGSHAHWDRKLDTRLAAACLSVQAMKGIEFGAGFALGDTPGSQAHDEIAWTQGAYTRLSDRSGGIEAGMTTGQPLRMRVVMKPLSSLPRPLRTVDMATHEEAEAITQRSDTCAVPRAGVVLESVLAFELADALLEKTGADTLDEMRRNLAAYLAEIARR